MKSNRNLRKLSMSIGDFIHYWGFRRVHGAIWTQLYLSEAPLSCTELAKRLELSKALISPALDELCNYKLIKEAPAPNEKTKLYKSAENLNEVIRHVLKTREAKMLKQITTDYSTFSGTKNEGADAVKVKALGEMITAANFMLEFFVAQKDLLNLPAEIEA